MSNINVLNLDNLEEVSGGRGNNPWRQAKPNVKSGTYLAIRSKTSYNESNELGSIYNGQIFSVNTNIQENGYIWAYFNGIEGWVNASYVTFL